jgi:hypothetical protein
LKGNPEYLRDNPMFTKGMSFEAFVDSVCELEIERMEPHYGEQRRLLEYQGQWLVDQVVRLEDIGWQWKGLEARFGLARIPWSNRTRDPLPADQGQISRATAERIERKFHRDVAAFEYCCPWPELAGP